MEYEHQIGGRAEMVKLLEDHLLKPTTIYEVDSYLRMSKQLEAVAPDCCFVYARGELTAMRKCKVCCHPTSVKKIMALINADPAGNYIILKDIAHGMSKPRFLDLKLGTRTHSDYISEQKKSNHILKSKVTTTSTLGLRLCGARFVRKIDGQLVHWKKDFGKSVNKETFWNAMTMFFDLPSEQRYSAIRQLLKIKVVLETSPKHRYFGSSLLIIVDDNDDSLVKVKLIDFSSMARSEEGSPQYDDVDKGAILGITNLLRMLANNS